MIATDHPTLGLMGAQTHIYSIKGRILAIEVEGKFLADNRGIDKFADVEVITLEGDGYSETQKGELNDFIQIQQPPDGRRG